MSQRNSQPEDQSCLPTMPKKSVESTSPQLSPCSPVPLILSTGFISSATGIEYLKAHWCRRPGWRQGTSETGSGSRRSNSSVHDRSRGSSDQLMRTEERLKEAEDKVKSLQIKLHILKKGVAQQPKEREYTIPPPRYMRESHEPNMRGLLREPAARRSRNRRSRHRQGSKSIHIARYNDGSQDRRAFYYEITGQQQPDRPAGPTVRPRRSHARGPVELDRASDRVRGMMRLPLFQSPSSRTSGRVGNRQLSQGSNEDGRPHGTRNVSATRSDHENRLIHANNRAETYSASVPSDVDLDITISYADSSEETQNRDDPCVTSLEPLNEYVLANEDDHLANDDSESACAASLGPLTEYVLANEEDYLAKDHSDCEDDL